MVEILQGNCQELIEDVVSRSINPVLVSDPPFNIGYHYDNYKDRLQQEEYDCLLQQVFMGRPHVLIHYPEALYRHAIVMKTAPLRVVSWVYNSNTAKQHRDIAYFGINPDFRKVGQPYKNPQDKRIAKRIAEGKQARLYDWWEINQVKNVSSEKTEHPCQMPVEVMKRVLGVLPDGITVIDPFMGTGTTGVAAKSLGIPFIGIELDEKYYAIAKDRLDG